jgi:probable HAF family extracellular repeat protein
MNAHAFLLDGGVFTEINFPGAVSTSHLNINRQGQIVGIFFPDNQGAGHGFLLSDGIYTQIDSPGAVAPGPGITATGAYGINDRGQIVGSSYDARGLRHGFLLENGVFTPFDPPGSMMTGVGGIHGFLATPVPEPGTLGLIGMGLAAFVALRRTLISLALLLGIVPLARAAPFTFMQIDAPGARGANSFAINDPGQIVGAFEDAGGIQHGYLLDGGVSLRSMRRARTVALPAGSMISVRSSVRSSLMMVSRLALSWIRAPSPRFAARAPLLPLPMGSIEPGKSWARSAMIWPCMVFS